MKKYLILLLLLAVLSGCATTSMNRGLASLVGQNIQTAFDAMGYPSGKQEFGNDTVYSWSVNESGALVLPATSSTSGYVGMTRYSGTTTYNQVVPISNECLIKLIADKNGVIKTWEWSGNEGGLARYAARLDHYYSQKVKSDASSRPAQPLDEEGKKSLDAWLDEHGVSHNKKDQ